MFIESNKIKVTPCAYRDPKYDWEANVPTEYTLTNLSGNGLRKSFRIHTEAGDQTVKFILGNYYFTILDSIAATDIIANTPWAHIELIEATVTESSVSSLILKNQLSNNWDASNYCLDGDDGYFYGIQFFDANPPTGANKFNLDLADPNSYFIADASQIKAKPGTGSTDVDTAAVVSNIIDSVADNSLKQVSATVASSTNSAAFGENTTATNKNQFVIGQNNATGTLANTVFIVGNGQDTSHKSNAFEVGLDGSARIAKNLDITGAATVGTNLDVKKTTTLRGTVTVKNNATFEKPVDFEDDVTLSGGNITVNSAATFTNGLTVSSGSTSVCDIAGTTATFDHVITNNSLNVANDKLAVSSGTTSISTADTQITAITRVNIACNSSSINLASSTISLASENIGINGEKITVSAPSLDINSVYTVFGTTITYALNINNATYGDMPIFAFRKNAEVMASIAADGTIIAKNLQIDGASINLLTSNIVSANTVIPSFIDFNNSATGEVLDTKGGTIKTAGLKTDSITAANGTVTVDGDLSVTGNGNIEAAHDITAGGQISANNFLATSDVRLKKNVKEYLCEKSILDLPVIKYDYKQGSKNNIGCTAQDLQTICPELVHKGKDGYLQIEESKIVYLLLEEVKKLRKEVNELKK